MKTHTGDMTTSYLLIENADIGDSGKYTCGPSNTGPASVKVHVFLHGKFNAATISNNLCDNFQLNNQNNNNNKMFIRIMRGKQGVPE